MIGIVLWRDVTAGKAIIWCEDQGDLAFYSHPSSIDTFVICVGDWVFFDLRLKEDVRLADNIRVLQEPGCPELVQDLVGEGETPVIPFAPKQHQEFTEAPSRLSPSAEKMLGEVPDEFAEDELVAKMEVTGNVIRFPSGKLGSRRSA